LIASTGPAAAAPFIATDQAPNVDSQGRSQPYACGRLILGSEGPPADDASFCSDAALRRLPGAEVAMGSHWLAGVRTGEPVLPATLDTVLFAVVLRGRARASQLGREEIMRQGGAILMTTCDVGSHTLLNDGRRLTVQLARAELAPLIPDLAGRLMRPFAPDLDALQLLVAHARAAIDLDSGAAHGLQRHVATQLRDLVVLLAGAFQLASDGSSGTGIRAARLHAIKAEIAGRLGQHDLSAETLALSQQISPDYVRKLFRDDGSSLSDHILAGRLAWAYAMLLDPQRSRQRIAAIAYEAGFSDLSYFNRTFRRRYAMSPSDLRAATGRPA
jgi:AraC-like DNA-binding protein